MICRRCGKDIADGSKTCPVCGISLGTYTKLRDYSDVKPAKKKSRTNRIVSIMTIVFSLIGIAAMIFFSSASAEDTDYQRMLRAYEKGDDQLLMGEVAKYRNKHPKSTERIAEGEEWLKILRGYAPAPEPTPNDDDSDAPVEDIIKTLATERIGFESIVLSEPNAEFARSLAVYWRNISGKTISRVFFDVTAYDADGNPVKCTVRDKADALLEQKSGDFKPNPDGDVYRSYWSNAWYGENIDHIKIKSVIIYYSDTENSWEELPMEVNK